MLFLGYEVSEMATIGERIKEIRKEKKITQSGFGKVIGVAGNTVTGYENGIRNPSDAVIMSICREFNVNEEWLRTGQGEKFNLDTDTDFLYGKALKRNNEFQMRLLNAILQLDDNELETIEKLVEKLQKK